MYYKEEDVEKIIFKDSKKYTEYLYNRIQEISKGLKIWVKPKIIYSDPINPGHGDVRPMTCFTDRVKVIKVISTNPIRIRDPKVSVGVLISLDYEENFPVSVYEASNLSSIRTAALAHVVINLTEKNYDDVLLIGDGAVGKYFRSLAPRKSKIRVHDIKYSQKLEKYEGQVIVSTTTSREAFLTHENSDFGLLISLGADTRFNFEISKSLMSSKDKIYVDTYDAQNVGDLYGFKKDIKGDLFDLAKDKSCDIFVSVGNPIMDALTVEYIENTKESHKGYEKWKTYTSKIMERKE
jgi:ornithine cyclodeaminase/alanine dehydrogenase-like protein (mu-crystallin family)